LLQAKEKDEKIVVDISKTTILNLKSVDPCAAISCSLNFEIADMMMGNN